MQTCRRSLVKRCSNRVKVWQLKLNEGLGIPMSLTVWPSYPSTSSKDGMSTCKKIVTTSKHQAKGENKMTKNKKKKVTIIKVVIFCLTCNIKHLVEI